MQNAKCKIRGSLNYAFAFCIFAFGRRPPPPRRRFCATCEDGGISGPDVMGGRGKCKCKMPKCKIKRPISASAFCICIRRSDR